MIAYPTVAIIYDISHNPWIMMKILTIVAKILAGTPFLRKSLELMKRCPNLFSCVDAVMLGNPDTGNPIPAEHIRAVAMINKRGCGSSRDSPIRVAMGTSNTAAMVWEILQDQLCSYR
jgi:hypothetical protein